MSEYALVSSIQGIIKYDDFPNGPPFKSIKKESGEDWEIYSWLPIEEDKGFLNADEVYGNPVVKVYKTKVKKIWPITKNSEFVQDIEALRSTRLEEIRTIAFEKILEVVGATKENVVFKELNLIYESSSSIDAKKKMDSVLAIRDASNKKEDKIKNSKSLKFINEFDVNAGWPKIGRK